MEVGARMVVEVRVGLGVGLLFLPHLCSGGRGKSKGYSFDADSPL